MRGRRDALACGVGLLLGLTAPAALAAGLYECRDASGRLVFQDRPCSAGLEARTLRAPGPAAPEPGSEPPDVRPMSGPPAPPAAVPPGESHVLVAVDGQDPAWRAAFASARARRAVEGGSVGVSLLRVFLEGARLGDDIQASGRKLDGPDDGGGGRFRELPSGGFLLVEHRAADGQADEEVTLASPTHGVTRLSLPVAPPGRVAAVGNVVLARAPAERLGRLEIRVSGAGPGARVVIGPLVVGGPYGRSLHCDPEGLCDPGALAAGSYELLLPDYDPRKSRFTTSVLAGQLTKLELSVRGPREVVRAGEEHARP